MGTSALDFIIRHIKENKILWTYHVNMRLRGRCINRKTIISAVDSFEIIEEYPDDKYFPSYLIYDVHKKDIFHIQIAIDKEDDNLRIITVYRPTLDKWNEDFKTRRKT